MNYETGLILSIILLPSVIALLLVMIRRIIGPYAGWIAGITAGLNLLATLALLPLLRQGIEPHIALNWLPQAGIQFILHLDWLTFPFLFTEALVTVFALIYALGYHHPDERTPFFYALLLIFGVGMAGTTLAGSVFLFYVFWELMLVASCVLILAWGEGPNNGSVALQYFLFTHLGSLLVLVALINLYDAAGSDSFVALRSGISLAPAAVTTITALFLIGFGVKMAVFPLHIWLPDAHSVAPMPVTIMLAAAMLSMGVYGILRFPMSIFSPSQIAMFALPMMVAGLVSQVYGALMAIAEQDIKRIIAYSSVSQMGYILFGLGTLTYEGIAGATLHVIYHGVVKALLFMCMGLVIRATNKRQISELGGLMNKIPLTAACCAVGVLAIAGVPMLAIFNSEWMIYSGGFHTTYPGLAVAMVLGSLLTVAYALRLFMEIFWGDYTSDGNLIPVSAAMRLPTVVLAGLTLLAGLFPSPVFAWIDQELTLILGGLW
ncbi:MAG: NADH-quinone oxidoreductase subunit M [Anaerolineaceae bacterium]|nr:NADH-quinone oxidoreductase subunit M [Anaerolineaceae bacterium]